MIKKLIYPTDRKCFFCYELSNNINNYLCSECYQRLEFIHDYRDIPSDRLNGVYSSLLYTSITKDLLHKFKFEDGNYLCKPLSEIMLETIKKREINNIDMIISVPLHRLRESERGYNQSYLLAREIGNKLGIYVGKDIVIKTKNKKPQSELQYYDRLGNLKEVFKVKRKEELRDKNILLIDDIITTGTTILEVSKVIIEAGAKSVTGLTLTSTNHSGKIKQ